MRADLRPTYHIRSMYVCTYLHTCIHTSYGKPAHPLQLIGRHTSSCRLRYFVRHSKRMAAAPLGPAVLKMETMAGATGSPCQGARGRALEEERRAGIPAGDPRHICHFALGRGSI